MKKFAAVLLWLAGALAFNYGIVTATHGSPYPFLAFAAGLAVATPIILVARRLLATFAEEAMRLDPRAPVLYWRSYSSDGMHPAGLRRNRNKLARLATYPWVPLTFEDALASSVSKLGPLMTVGKPAEKLPAIGIGRVDIAEVDWHRTLLELAGRSQAVVWHAGWSDGAWWELRQLAGTVHPARLLLVVPDPKLEPALYARFVQRADAFFPKAFPVQIDGAASFFRFEDDWTPVALRNRFRPFPLWAVLGMGQPFDMDKTLAPFLARHTPITPAAAESARSSATTPSL